MFLTLHVQAFKYNQRLLVVSHYKISHRGLGLFVDSGGVLFLTARGLGFHSQLCPTENRIAALDRWAEWILPHQCSVVSLPDYTFHTVEFLM